MSRISDFTALDPLRYLTACAFVIVLRVAIVSSISQSDLAPPTQKRRHADRTFLYEGTKPTTRTFLLSQRGPLTCATLSIYFGFGVFRTRGRFHLGTPEPLAATGYCGSAGPRTTASRGRPLPRVSWSSASKAVVVVRFQGYRGRPLPRVSW